MAADPDVIDIDQRPYIPIEFYGRVDVVDGRPVIVMANPSLWLATLSKLVGVVKLTLQRPRKRRSQEANAYMWACVYPDLLEGLRKMAFDAGPIIEDGVTYPARCPFEDVDELHEGMKYLFFGVDVVKLPGGGMIERPKRTKTLDSKQYSLFVDFVKDFAAERGIYVRNPGEEITA